MNPGNERRWVEKAQQWDPEAFWHLYQRYFPRIYAYIACRVGRVQDTGDLVAETFLKAVE